MKKVRYLAGAVGAVPVLGMMMPATATAVAAHPPKAKVKTVSLAHGIAARTLGPPAVNQASSCTGTTVVHEKFQGTKHYKPSLSTTFWYKKAAGGSAYCIGTVEDHWYNDNGGQAGIFLIRIYSGGKLAYSTSGRITEPNNHTEYGVAGVHRWNGFSRGLPIQICTRWESEFAVLAGPQCKTLG